MLRLAEGVSAAEKSAGQLQIRHPLILNKVTRKIQKAVASAGGFALVELVLPPVGKQVFLLVGTTITTVMHDMTPAATTVKKAALGRSKKSAVGGKKTPACISLFYKHIYKKYDNLFFVPAKPDFFYRQRRTFCICGFSAYHQAGAAGCGGEYPRVRSRDIIRHTRTHRAKP